MEIRGYKRIKKKDIKRWFKGSNLVLYVLILLLLFALIMFAYRTIAGMHNDNIDNELNNQTEDLDNESSFRKKLQHMLQRISHIASESMFLRILQLYQLLMEQVRMEGQ